MISSKNSQAFIYQNKIIKATNYNPRLDTLLEHLTLWMKKGKKGNVKKKMLIKHFRDHARIYLSFTYVEDLKRKERIIKK